MAHKTMNQDKGHWILAKMGKKVLRPGGKELTLKLIDRLDIGPEDSVTEFAPGLGYTASITLQKHSKSYTGVERNEEAAAVLQKKFYQNGNKIIISEAANSTIDSESMDKVYGEAMLTMQAGHRKAKIIREANRILKPGGLYGIHELGITPSTISGDLKEQIQRDLATTIKVNARPVTENDWKKILEDEGFEIISVDTSPMHLLKRRRIINDEGLGRTVKMCFNVLTHPKARKRINEMQKIFAKYEQNLNGIAIVARKK